MRLGWTCKRTFVFCGLTIIAYVFTSQKAIARGGKNVKEPWEEKDEFGTVVFATVQTVGIYSLNHDHVDEVTVGK